MEKSNNLFFIASQFCNSQQITDLCPLGNGLVNDTYRVTTTKFCFVLQRVNRHVFPEPKLISENWQTLNQHIQGQGNIALRIPELLLTRSGQGIYQHDGDYWRAQSFFEQTESLESLRTLADAEQVGSALGGFHRLLSTIDVASLHDTLPGFHITPAYLKQYHHVAVRNSSKKNTYCEHFITQFEVIADTLEQAKELGLLRLRVIHGDPKLNNFLFDQINRNVVSLIDLDTVKPGLVHYDIADCLRSCCHQTDVNEFDLTICEAILKNYLVQVGCFFSVSDYQYLYPAIRLLPFELGIRFYTDYLDGNRYFKVTDPLQNLQRAIGQFRLCTSIMKQETAINTLIESLQSIDMPLESNKLD